MSTKQKKLPTFFECKKIVFQTEDSKYFETHIKDCKEVESSAEDDLSDNKPEVDTGWIRFSLEVRDKFLYGHHLWLRTARKIEIKPCLENSSHCYKVDYETGKTEMSSSDCVFLEVINWRKAANYRFVPKTYISSGSRFLAWLSV